MLCSFRQTRTPNSIPAFKNISPPIVTSQEIANNDGKGNAAYLYINIKDARGGRGGGDLSDLQWEWRVVAFSGTEFGRRK